MQYILSLDQGTTSSRTLVIDKDARVRAVAQKEFRQITPQNGWVEHDPEDIWNSQIDTVRDVMRKMNITADDIAALGITNQRETTLVWQRSTGKALHNAIVWQDRRTAKFCQQLKDEGHEDTFRRKAGLPLDPYFSGTKLRYILDEHAEARRLAAADDLCFGTVDTWLIYNLTGGKEHVTDHSNASRTLMYNLETNDWDDELLDLLGVPRSVLPEIRNNDALFGTVDASVGIGAGMKIHGVAGDQQAALFGQQCWSAGDVKNTYGTGCFALMNVGNSPIRSERGLLSTMGWITKSQKAYALEGSVFVAGAAVQWLRDGLNIISDSNEIEALAKSVDGSDGVAFVPALTGLGSPHWDPMARGTIIGLHRGTTKAHIARATLEAIALQSHDLISAMEADSGKKMTELRVDGGATRNDLLMQIQADMIDTDVRRPSNQEMTAMGAAYLAGLGCGYWKANDLRSDDTSSDVFHSQADEESARLKDQWQRAVERSKAWMQG